MTVNARPCRFSFPVGERKIMNHFVVKVFPWLGSTCG
jgi:hypothetical protein